MLGWNNLPIRLKLPMTFAAVAVLVTLTVSAGSTLIAKAGQVQLAQENFSVAGTMRRDKMTDWLGTVKASVITAASGTQASAAVYSLGSAFNDLGEDAQAQLQADYIANNAYPMGKRQMLDRAEGNAFYHSQHFAVHPSFRTLIEQQDFYDLFVVDMAGNIIYTVAKESDFGANLQTGPLSDSNLAVVTAQAMAGKQGDVFFSEFAPYAPSNYAPAMFAAAPILNDLDKVIGVMAVQLSFEEVTRILDLEGLTGVSSNAYLIDSSGRYMTSSRFEDGFVSGDNVADLPHLAAQTTAEGSFYDNTPLASGELGLAQTFSVDNGSHSWTLVIERDSADLMASFQDLVRFEIALGLVCLLGSIGIGIWVSRGYARPISMLGADIQNVANADFDTAIKNTDRGDELGMIAKALDDLRQVLAAGHAQEEAREAKRHEQSEVVDTLTDALRGLAAGDLSKSITKPFAADYEVLREYFNDAMSKMSSAVAQISTATEGIQAQAGEITRSSEELAHRTEVQAATLEQTAAAMDEMTSSVKSAAVGVEEVETIVRDARKDADQSGIVVNEAVAAMAEIEKSSDQISQIIGVIDDIAFQTNLLALNAGVEAARAGDAGRGFAVVASEVGALAQRASSAAREIKTLIGASSEHVERGVDRVKQAGDALQQIAKRVTHISTLTSNIATGAREQSIGLNEINLGVTQLDQATQKNAAMAEEATAASQLLKQGASELMELVGRFNIGGAPRRASNLVDLSDFADVPAVADTYTPAEPAPMQKAAGDGRGIWQDF